LPALIVSCISTPLACGELTGQATTDDHVVIALQPLSGSNWYGVAILAGSKSVPVVGSNQTQVTVYLFQAGTPAAATPAARVPPIRAPSRPLPYSAPHPPIAVLHLPPLSYHSPARTAITPVTSVIHGHHRHCAATGQDATSLRVSPVHGLHRYSPPKSPGALTRRVITLSYSFTHLE